MPITALLFDLGSTLIYSRDPWPPIYEEADQALLGVLRQAGFDLDPGSLFPDGCDTFLDSYYAERGDGAVEKTTPTALRELLAANGFPQTDETTLRAALDALYGVTQANWYLEEDALPTLQALLGQGYRLGMISNTSDDKNVQQLVDRWGLRPFFEVIVTSAGCGIRKPDGRIFQVALDHFRVPSATAAMIGDTPEADVLGANRMGLHAIWITRRAVRSDPSPARPDATISRLDEIPSLLAALG